MAISLLRSSENYYLLFSINMLPLRGKEMLFALGIEAEILPALRGEIEVNSPTTRLAWERPKNIFAKTLDKGVLADYLRALF